MEQDFFYPSSSSETFNQQCFMTRPDQDFLLSSGLMVSFDQQG